MKSDLAMPYRILMFAPGFAPYAASENIVNSKLTLAFVQNGWHIDIISRADNNYYGSQWQEPWLPLRNMTHEVTYSHSGICGRVRERISNAVTTGYPIAGVRWASRALDIAQELHKKEHYHIILSRSTPDIAHLPAMLFARRSGLPWIANWNDPVKMPPPYGEGISMNLGFICESFLRKVALTADFHTFPSERLRNYIQKYLPVDARRSTVIPHIAEAFIPRTISDAGDNFTISHAGHLDARRSPDSFLEGLSLFIKKGDGRERAKFINIGLDNAGLRERAERYGVAAHLEITGALGYQETLNRLRNSDLLLVVEAPCAEGIFLPSKFVDYVQTGRPILCVSPVPGTLHDILTGYGGGLAVPPDNAATVADALETFFTARQLGNLDDSYGSKRLYETYSPATILTKYEELFTRLGLAV